MTITDVSRWYNKGEISVDEAITLQQRLCKHLDYCNIGQWHCLTCGIAGYVRGDKFEPYKGGNN